MILFSPQLPDIQGFMYQPDFISAETEQSLIDQIDQQNWLNDLKRRVQHYGYKYDYKARRLDSSFYLGVLPDWLSSIAHRLKDDGYFKKSPDQVIVNEYMPGQGISAHIDCEPCFGDVIASLSLGANAIMQFDQGQERQEIYLERRSLIILSGDARYKWTHAIPARQSDKINGQIFKRSRRVSLTFRTVIL